MWEQKNATFYLRRHHRLSYVPWPISALQLPHPYLCSGATCWQLTLPHWLFWKKLLCFSLVCSSRQSHQEIQTSLRGPSFSCVTPSKATWRDAPVAHIQLVLNSVAFLFPYFSQPPSLPCPLLLPPSIYMAFSPSRSSSWKPSWF